MTEMAMRIVNALRVECGERTCTACPCDDWCSGREVNCLENDAADLIESMSEQLEKVTRERDAAVSDFTEFANIAAICVFCKDFEFDKPCGKDISREDCWRWRGVEKEVEG